ncbi:unnamed protein product [Heligmosomoides polygyrus]|uniref:G_PROTEIN_RECEP_F1_2 domain-containing protein n=1 Tax=Heligmosomoides polygyrus TaxID=6339 RepID=A0A183GNQ5_HELPZ|nr:unnamed protein product [Heligmosomoides polygyrus]
MLFYGLCDIFVVALKVFYSFDALQHPVAVAVDTMFTHTYAMIMPLQSCCLVERLAATLLFHSYEKTENGLCLVFLPMIIFDTLISLLDIVTRYLEYDYVFQPERCGTESNYLIIYIAIVTVATSLELTESTLILCKYPNTVRILFKCKARTGKNGDPRGTHFAYVQSFLRRIRRVHFKLKQQSLTLRNN